MWNETLKSRTACDRPLIEVRQIAKPGVLPTRALATAIAVAATVSAASATTFRHANRQGFTTACSFARPGTNLATACTQDVPSANTATASDPIGSFTAPSAALAVQERLRIAREPPQKQGGGASSDEVVSLGQGLSVFASAGAEALNHFNNRYEDGYNSTIPSVTGGADYQITPWLVAGLAFNYFNFNGEYDDGGDFNTNSFGPIAYLSFLPFNGAFADVILGYARKDYFRDRHAVIQRDGGPPVNGHATGGNGGNEYSTSLLLGYDYPIENFTIGPRLGLNYIATQIDDYREHGNSGLGLRYSGQDTSSLQSSLGAVTTVAISTQFGVLLPQVSVSWVHDYDVSGRNIDASFIDADAPKFKFKREPVAPNFANISVGVSALLPNNWQPFVNLKTIQGNENLVSYGGIAGLRVGL